MEIAPKNIDFVEWIGGILNCSFSEDTQGKSYIFRFSENRVHELCKDELNSALQELRTYDEISETVISNRRSYEVVLNHDPFKFVYLPGNIDHTAIEVYDSENELTYRLIRPTTLFSLFLLYKTSLLGDPSKLTKIYGYGLEGRHKFWTDKKYSILDILRTVGGAKLSLRIDSKKERSAQEFEKLSSAFLFNAAYNTNASLVPVTDFSLLVRSKIIPGKGAFKLNELDPPRRYYIPDLIHHYQLAIGTINPMLEYISYYHIIEHFFESVFNDDLIDRVKKKLTHPNFSYKRKRDISLLIKDIGKSIKIRDESMTFSEQEGLNLALRKFVNLNELTENLKNSDEILLAYYKKNKVDFSGGVTVDLESDDKEMVYKNLAGRIYQTRNAIVHSKESEKAKFTPFKDDISLTKEIPLLKHISEQIIFASSEAI